MSWIDGLWHRVRVWMRARSYAREQAEERRMHEEMKASNSRLQKAQEPNMRLPIVDALRQDVRYALRGMRRSPGFTAMVVVTLALGVGANAAVFSLLDRIFGQPPEGLSRPEELRRVYTQFPDHPTQPGMVFPSWSWPAFAAVREANGGVAPVIAWTDSDDAVLRDGEREIPTRISYVTHDYFSVLGVETSRGRLFGPEEQSVEFATPVAVISHSLWKSAFASAPGVLGRAIEVDGVTATIVGIAGTGFSGLELNRTDVFLPANMFSTDVPFYRNDGNFFQAAARFVDSAVGDQFWSRGTAARRRYHEGFPELRPTASDATSEVLTGSIIEARGPGQQSLTMSVSTRAAGVTIMVLLITGANIASLLLVRAMRRRRELAVRLALGVPRSRLLSQMVVESLALAALAGGAATLVAAWGGGVLRRLMMPEIQWAEPVLDSRTVALALTTSALLGVAAGVTPGWLARRLTVTAALRGGRREGRDHRSWPRVGLLVTQGALSIVLLTGAGLFLRSLRNVEALPLGYEADAVAWVRFPMSMGPPPEPTIVRDVAQKFARIPGVTGVALSSSAPMAGSSITRIFLPGRDSVPRLGPADPGAGFLRVDPEFMRVTGLQLVAGRSFRSGEEAVALVNETMASLYWPGASAIGQCLILGRADDGCTEVVGVTQNPRVSEIIEEPTSRYFIPLTEADRLGAIVLRIEPGSWPTLSAAGQQLVQTHFTAPYRLDRMSNLLAPQLRPWRLGTQLFTAFGILALLVTAVGIYSVMAYTVSQRTHEMGVRIALGARVKDVLRLVVGEGLGVILLGLVVGIAIALALGRLVASLLYGVTPRDPMVMISAAIVLITVGLLASSVPAWRATRVDPVRALSAE
jgi:predicted permease